MPRERWKYDESERAMAQEFIEWALPLVNATSFVKVAVRLGVSRRGLAAVVNNKRGWRRRKDPVRQVWIDHRERLLQTSLTDLIAECEAAKERKDAESAQAEVSDSEAPDARSEDSSTIEPSTEDSEGSEESAPDEVTLTDVSTVVAPDVPVADVNAADPPLTEGDVYEVPEIDVPAGAFAPEPVDEDEGEAPQRGTKSADEAVSISGDTPCAETPVEEVGGVLQAGGMAGNAESTVTGDQKMPAILDLEEMSALIDARRPRGSYGQPPMTVMVDDRLMNVANESDFRELQELIVSAQTHEEVARIAGAPVLAVYPGLSLENAKICALMRIGGWHPTERDREPPGLQGDAPLMLYNGLPADFVHPGAMALAFARTLMWKDTHGLSATRMRYGVLQSLRRMRYVVEVFKDRPEMIGYRKSDWIPEWAWPDHDLFFGSLPWRDEFGRWWPAPAQLIDYWYNVRDAQQAFRGTEAETRSTAFWLQIERERLLTEHLLIGDPYMLTFAFHGFGRTLPDSTRNAERRVMRERIAQIDEELKRRRLGSAVRRVMRCWWSDLFGRQLRGKRIREFRQVQSRLRDEAIQERIEQERPAFERQWGEVVLRARTIPPEQLSYNEMYGIMYVNGRPMLQARKPVEPEPQPERESRLSFSWPKALGRKVRGVGMPFGISLTIRKKESVDDDRQSEQKPEEKPTPVEVAPELLPRYRIGLFGKTLIRAWPFGLFRCSLYELTGQLACGLQDRRWERWYEPGTEIMQEHYNLVTPLSWDALMPEVRVYQEKN